MEAIAEQWDEITQVMSLLSVRTEPARFPKTIAELKSILDRWPSPAVPSDRSSSTKRWPCCNRAVWQMPSGHHETSGRRPRSFDALHAFGDRCAPVGEICARHRSCDGAQDRPEQRRRPPEPGECAARPEPSERSDGELRKGRCSSPPDRPRSCINTRRRTTTSSSDLPRPSRISTRRSPARPNSVEASLGNRGIVLRMLNRPADALASYERGLALDTSFPPSSRIAIAANMLYD